MRRREAFVRGTHANSREPGRDPAFAHGTLAFERIKCRGSKEKSALRYRHGRTPATLTCATFWITEFHESGVTMKRALRTLAALRAPVTAALAQTDSEIRQILADRIEIVVLRQPGSE